MFAALPPDVRNGSAFPLGPTSLEAVPPSQSVRGVASDGW